MRISDWSSDVCSSDLFLFLRNGLGNGATVVCFCRLNTALPAAPAKLHQTAFRQPAVWNIARQGRLNDGTGAWTQAYIFVQIAQTQQAFGQVEGRILHGRHPKLLSQLEGQPPYGSFRPRKNVG